MKTTTKFFIVLLFLASIYFFVKKNKKQTLKGVMNEEWNEFINKSIKYKNYKKIFFLGYVSDKIGMQIKRKTGINTAQFKFFVNSDSIRHVLNSHNNEEKEKAKGQIKISKENLYFLVEILTNPDEILPANKQKKGEKDEAIKFVKYIDNFENIAVVEIILDKNALYFKTMYIKNLT